MRTECTSRDSPSLAVAAVVVTVAGFVLISAALTQVVLSLGWLITGRPGSLGDYLVLGQRFGTPLGLLATNIGIAATVLVPMTLIRRGFRVEPRWLLSVCGRFRWRWFALSLAVTVPILGGMAVIGVLTGQDLAMMAAPGFLAYAVIIVVTSPLQAAAEEIVFRGFLTQALGTLNRYIAVVVPALIFALLHGNQDLWLFANRFGFGVLAGILVVATGGLEAVVAIHVINNLVSLGFAASGGVIEQSRTLAALPHSEAVVSLAGYGLCTAFIALLARVLGVHRKTIF